VSAEIESHTSNSYLNIEKQCTLQVLKFSPMRDWRSTPLEWLSVTRDLDRDLGSGQMAYSRASLIGLYVHTKFPWNRKNVFSRRTNRSDPTKFKVTWHKKLGQISKIRNN